MGSISFRKKASIIKSFKSSLLNGVSLLSYRCADILESLNKPKKLYVAYDSIYPHYKIDRFWDPVSNRVTNNDIVQNPTTKHIWRDLLIGEQILNIAGIYVLDDASQFGEHGRLVYMNGKPIGRFQGVDANADMIFKIGSGFKKFDVRKWIIGTTVHGDRELCERS